MITFVTCWYKFNNKFNDNIYKEWIDNFLSNVNNFCLVVYTNKDSYILLQKYSFKTEWFGWCDIGYFRGRPCDLSCELLKTWPNIEKINNLDKDKIYYARVQNNIELFNSYIKIILNKNVFSFKKYG